MEDSFKTYLFAFVLVSLFGMLILTAVIQVGNTYNRDTSEVASGSLSINKFNDSISSIEQDTKQMEESFSKQSIWSAVAGIVVEGIFGIALTMITLILTPFSIISDIMNNVLHIPVFVTSVLMGLLILGIILGIWRLLRIGD